MAMAMRLDKFLSHMGYGTRNEVKNIIKNGWVTIEGKTIKKADHQVKEDQIVYVDDTPVSYIQYEYYILNKPAGYVSATEDNVHPTIMELIPSIRKDLYPVGRNPISIIVPCHRVIGANHKITGYAGGIDKKIALLEIEGYDLTILK